MDINKITPNKFQSLMNAINADDKKLGLIMKPIRAIDKANLPTLEKKREGGKPTTNRMIAGIAGAILATSVIAFTFHRMFLEGPVIQPILPKNITPASDEPILDVANIKDLLPSDQFIDIGYPFCPIIFSEGKNSSYFVNPPVFNPSSGDPAQFTQPSPISENKPEPISVPVNTIPGENSETPSEFGNTLLGVIGVAITLFAGLAAYRFSKSKKSVPTDDTNVFAETKLLNLRDPVVIKHESLNDTVKTTTPSVVPVLATSSAPSKQSTKKSGEDRNSTYDNQSSPKTDPVISEQPAPNVTPEEKSVVQNVTETETFTAAPVLATSKQSTKKSGEDRNSTYDNQSSPKTDPVISEQPTPNVTPEEKSVVQNVTETETFTAAPVPATSSSPDQQNTRSSNVDSTDKDQSNPTTEQVVFEQPTPSVAPIEKEKIDIPISYENSSLVPSKIPLPFPPPISEQLTPNVAPIEKEKIDIPIPHEISTLVPSKTPLPVSEQPAPSVVPIEKEESVVNYVTQITEMSTDIFDIDSSLTDPETVPPVSPELAPIENQTAETFINIPILNENNTLTDPETVPPVSEQPAGRVTPMEKEKKINLGRLSSRAWFDVVNTTLAFIYGKPRNNNPLDIEHLNHLYEKDIPYLLADAKKKLILEGSPEKKLNYADWVVPIRLEPEIAEKLGFKDKTFFLPFSWLYPLITGTVVRLKYGSQPVEITISDRPGKRPGTFTSFKREVEERENQVWNSEYSPINSYEELLLNTSQISIAHSQKRYPDCHIPCVGELEIYKHSSSVCSNEAEVTFVRNLVSNKTGKNLTLSFEDSGCFKEGDANTDWAECLAADTSEIKIYVPRYGKNCFSLMFDRYAKTCIKIVNEKLIIWQIMHEGPLSRLYLFGKYFLGCVDLKSSGLSEEDFFTNRLNLGCTYHTGVILVEKKSISLPDISKSEEKSLPSPLADGFKENLEELSVNDLLKTYREKSQEIDPNILEYILRRLTFKDSFDCIPLHDKTVFLLALPLLEQQNEDTLFTLFIIPNPQNGRTLLHDRDTLIKAIPLLKKFTFNQLARILFIPDDFGNTPISNQLDGTVLKDESVNRLLKQLADSYNELEIENNIEFEKQFSFNKEDGYLEIIPNLRQLDKRISIRSDSPPSPSSLTIEEAQAQLATLDFEAEELQLPPSNAQQTITWSVQEKDS
jgi:hypothetical protein